MQHPKTPETPITGRSAQAQVTGRKGTDARRWCQTATPGAHPDGEKGEKETNEPKKKRQGETEKKNPRATKADNLDFKVSSLAVRSFLEPNV